jgi:nicotinate-nucleotide pyrophosphorylase (carboxylating)
MTDQPDIDTDISRIISAALLEDIGTGDLTTGFTVSGKETGKATVVCGAEGVHSGARIAERVFHAIDPALTIEVAMNDGDAVRPGDVVLTVTGEGAAILKGERTALNFIQRMSGRRGCG